MFSRPVGTKQETGLVGESGVQDAGTRDSTMVDRSKPRPSRGVQAIIV